MKYEIKGIGRTVLPPEALGKNLFLASSSLWWLLALLGCGHITTFSASVFTHLLHHVSLLNPFLPLSYKVLGLLDLKA